MAGKVISLEKKIITQDYYTRKVNILLYMSKWTFSYSLWVGRRLVVCPCGPSFWQTQIGDEKYILRPFRMRWNVFSVSISIESNFSEKKDQNFHICLRSGPTGLTLPPSLTVSLTVFFMTSLRLLAKCLLWVSHSAPFYKQNRRQKWSGKHGSYKQIWRTWKRHELDAQLWIYIHWEYNYTRGLNCGWLRPCMQELVTLFHLLMRAPC